MTTTDDEILTVLKAIEARLADAHAPRPALLERDSFAALLGLGVSTFDRLRATGRIGPAPVKVGGGVRWHRQEVDAWLRRRTPAGELYDADDWPAVWRQCEA